MATQEFTVLLLRTIEGFGLHGERDMILSNGILMA